MRETTPEALKELYVQIRTMRHEFHTPINQIIGYAELLQEEAADEGHDFYLDDLEKIKRAARNIQRMVDGLFDSDLPGQDSPSSESLPETAAEAGPQTEGADSEASGGKEGLILVVDDNEMNRDMLARRLERTGYTVARARDGEEALSQVCHRPFDLILLDVVMPGMSGLDVLREVRQTYPASKLPIIMATGQDSSRDVVNALVRGANDYVTKPLDFPVVMARIETQLSLARATAEVRELAKQLELRNVFIRKTFGRYLSDDVVSELLSTPEGQQLGGEKRTLTILMSDLRGFSLLTERLPPEKVVQLLNGYLGQMSDIIIRYKGTIDEFIGDAILAVFGAPVTREDDAERAVACALEMQLAMSEVNRWCGDHDLPTIEMGIGINTGEAIVGNIGSHLRAKYGVVGTTINLAARLESYTVGGQIFISEATKEVVGDILLLGEERQVHPKGSRRPLSIFEVVGLGGAYQIELENVAEEYTGVQREIYVQCSRVRGKEIDAAVVRGLLRAVSPRCLLVHLPEGLEPGSNLRLIFECADLSERLGELFVKVVKQRSPRPECTVLRVTWSQEKMMEVLTASPQFVGE